MRLKRLFYVAATRAKERLVSAGLCWLEQETNRALYTADGQLSAISLGI